MQSKKVTRRRLWGSRKRRATMLVMLAVGEVVALGVCGMAIDVGHVCVAWAELQRSADAGALAAAARMMDISDLNSDPVPYYVSENARLVASEYVSKNPCRGKPLALGENQSNAVSGDLVLGHYTSESDGFDPYSSKYNSAELLVRRDAGLNGRLPLFFGPLFGVSDVNVRAGAAAFIETDVKGFKLEEGDGVTCKLLPFAIQINLWEERLLKGYDDYTHDAENRSASYGPDGIYEVKLFPYQVSPGNFGTVDLGSPNNSTADLARQILYGMSAYDLSFFPDSTIQLDDAGTLPLNGDTGISAGCKDELAAIEGHPRIIPLYSTMSGNGDNAMFTIVAFVGVTVLDSRLTGAMKTKHVTVQPCFVVDCTAIGGGNDGTTSKYVRTPPRLRKKKLQ